MSSATRLALVSLVGLALAAVGCSLQGEGERCSIANGSNDCEAPLVCTKRELLTGSTVDRCCPADRTQSTTASCAVTFTGGTDAGSSPTQPLVDAGALPADGAPASLDSSVFVDAARTDAALPADAAAPAEASPGASSDASTSDAN